MKTNDPAHPNVSDRSDVTGLWDHTLRELEAIVSTPDWQELYDIEKGRDERLSIVIGGLVQRLQANPQGVSLVVAAAAYGLLQLSDAAKRGEKAVVA
jgi:hypothetical protein